jgi:NNMT/PNMT/TEMT family protein
MQLNADLPWEEFDPDEYHRTNYSRLRDDDRQIIELVRDFFCDADAGQSYTGIDVGTGSNLYPALTMLPFCQEITLWEHSPRNVEWLRREVLSFGRSWEPFWDILSKKAPHDKVDDPRKELAACASVTQRSIFRLPAQAWNMGTMFFVAESISSSMGEFRLAIQRFLGSLRPGAPFAAAFMENSTGHYVGSHLFPAVAISAEDVEDCLAPLSSSFKIERIDICAPPLREGYTGMLIARGLVNAGVAAGAAFPRRAADMVTSEPGFKKGARL